MHSYVLNQKGKYPKNLKNMRIFFGKKKTAQPDNYSKTWGLKNDHYKHQYIYTICDIYTYIKKKTKTYCEACRMASKVRKSPSSI